MSYFQLIAPKQQWVDSNGNPLSGAKLFTYSAGTSTKKTTYTDDTGAVANTNPIVLNTAGQCASGVYGTSGSYKFVLAPSTDTDPPLSPIWTQDGVAGINDVAASAVDQWLTLALTPTYVSSTSFTVPGDNTGTLGAGRRLKSQNTAGTVYSVISSASYGLGVTTVVVRSVSGALDSGLSSVQYGIISGVNQSAPDLDIYCNVAQAAIGAPRNRIINGDMRIDQRNEGAAQNITIANVYCVDRWAVVATAAVAGTLTAQRIATAAPGGAQYCLRLARTAGAYVNALVATQVIETSNCYDLAGLQVTLSFKARKGSAYSAALTAFLITGTGTDEGVNLATAGTWAGAANFSVVPTLTTSFQSFSVTATLGASVTEIGALFNTGNFAGVGGANDYLDITDVQLEIGPLATTFGPRRYGDQLFACELYYCKSFASGTAPAQNAGINGAFYGVQVAGASTSQGLGTIRFPRRMRNNSSTITTYNTSAANAQPRNSTTGTDFSGVATTAVSAGSFGLVATSPIGSAAGNNFYVHWTAENEL